MATKKSTKPTKSKHLEMEHRRIGKLVVIFGVLLICILAVFFYVKGDLFNNYENQQKLQAFDGLLKEYIYNRFEEEGQTARVTGTGITKDKDLYADFIVTKYEDHVPMATRKGRLHFQCHDENSKPKENGCSQAYNFDEWTETSEKYRSDYREYLEIMEEYTEKGNATKSDEELEAIQKEYKEVTKKYLYLFE